MKSPPWFRWAKVANFDRAFFLLFGSNTGSPVDDEKQHRTSAVVVALVPCSLPGRVQCRRSPMACPGFQPVRISSQLARRLKSSPGRMSPAGRARCCTFAAGVVIVSTTGISSTALNTLNSCWISSGLNVGIVDGPPLTKR